MLATQRYYYLALAVFLVIVSFSFFLFQHGEPAVYKAVEEPHRYSDSDYDRDSDSDCNLEQRIENPPSATPS